MNEELNESGEDHKKSPENYSENIREAQENLAKHHEKAAKQAAEQQPDESAVDKLHDTAEQKAESSAELKTRQIQEESTEEDYAPPGAQLKTHALNQSLAKIRRQLPRGQRQFSKLIHNPAVDKISDVTGATVARPSGLLLGGLCSLISGFVLLLLCRYYGYEYNFLAALVFFACGFAIGIVLEAVLRLFRKARS